MNKEKSECIKVSVRCRPLSEDEIKADRQWYYFMLIIYL